MVDEETSEGPRENEIRGAVRDRYKQLAQRDSSCCGQPEGTKCACKAIYPSKEIISLPSEVIAVSAGCGNPTAIAELRQGMVVVDFGSGGGIDVFLASKQVGPKGKVYGIDATPEMVTRARRTAEENGFDNVEFRLGEIEHVPLESNVADVLISNCVINLSPDKRQVFREAFRILKPGGRLAVSDMVLLRDLPREIRKDLIAWSSCLSGALPEEDYIGAIKSAGFERIEVVKKVEFSDEQLRSGVADRALDVDLSSLAASVGVVAFKPSG